MSTLQDLRISATPIRSFIRLALAFTLAPGRERVRGKCVSQHI